MFRWRFTIDRSGAAMFAGESAARRDLVEERLEEVEVAAVDERDVRRARAAARARA